MPNWCEGSLKVRGTKGNMTKFILEGLHPVGFLGEKHPKLSLNEYGEIFVAVFDSKFAWGISADELLKTCEKYHVDMKIHGFERGMEFNQVIEIVDGKILKDEELHFKDYQWDCICPNIGG